MAEDVIRMDMEFMDELHGAYTGAADALGPAKSEVFSIAQQLEDGALLGSAGEKFTQGCRAMARAMESLAEKHAELAKDILYAKRAMEEADKEAGEFYQ
ncbi:MAG: hypothetical protein PVH41_00275 [Anaerolineae bacterium]|jgi:uncharacterized protein YukE